MLFSCYVRVNFESSSSLFMRTDEFQYIKISAKVVDLRTRPWGKKYRVDGVYSPEPRTEVYCVKLNSNISKLKY